jgi:hypothetical protein
MVYTGILRTASPSDNYNSAMKEKGKESQLYYDKNVTHLRSRSQQFGPQRKKAKKALLLIFFFQQIHQRISHPTHNLDKINLSCTPPLEQ